MPRATIRTPEMVEDILTRLSSGEPLAQICRDEGYPHPATWRKWRSHVVTRPVIYGLYDKAGNLRYIGKANDPEKRLTRHMSDAWTRDNPIHRWIRKNGKPEMRVLEEGCVDWEDAERRHIAEARQRGERLLNVANGGDQPTQTREQRAACAAAMNAAIRVDPLSLKIWHWKRAIAQGLRDGLVRNETRAKLREAARASPRRFGKWTHLPDREENPDGSAVIVHG